MIHTALDAGLSLIGTADAYCLDSSESGDAERLVGPCAQEPRLDAREHGPDPAVPFADSIGTLRDPCDDGTIGAAGVSNVGVEQIDEAHAILGRRLVSVENQDVSPQQVALASLLAAGDHVIVLLGAREPSPIGSSVAPAEVELGADDLAAIGAAALPQNTNAGAGRALCINPAKTG